MSEAIMEKRLRHLRLMLLSQKGWRYLRYVHLRRFIMDGAQNLQTVGVVGAGYGLAELALAVEFPEIEFFLTDIVATGRPNYWQAMDIAMRWTVKNVRFGVWDVLSSAPRRFDAVVSTEVLEHIPQAEAALSNQCKAARHAVYALTPFATGEDNLDPVKRVAVLKEHEHIVCGYDSDYFEDATGSAETMGAYWRGAGISFRSKLHGMSRDEIEANYDRLIDLAVSDLRLDTPSRGECMAIKAVIRL